MKNSAKYIPTRISYKRIALIIALILTTYILENFSAKLHINNRTFTNIIKPILWSIVIIIVWRMPDFKAKAKLRHRKTVYLWAFIFGVIYILINIFAGIFDGLGKSPYSHSFIGILMNLASVGYVLVGRELIRSYLVNSTAKKENYLVFIAVALLMTITNFSINKYLQLNNLESSVQFAAQYFAPEFSNNLFASYLVYLGGPLVSIIYLGIIQCFHWLSPILPNLKWINTALIGILLPVFFLMSMQSIYTKHSKEVTKRQDDNDDVMSWVFTSVISIVIMWFAVGVFPIYPSVIATGSMEPEIKPGDVILVEKIEEMVDIDNLKINDIVQFQRDGVRISHRIVAIINDEEEGIQFKTKGDNNSGPDVDLVKPQDIKGTIKYTLPKIGWITLLIRSDNEISMDEVVF